MNFEEDLARAFAITADRPKPKLGPPVGTPPAGQIPCGRCRRLMPISNLRYYATGVCTASDSICEECEALVPQHALVVCVGCKAVVARMAPERLKSGFRIEARKIYHTNACPKCKPGVERSMIIEAELFYQKSK